MKKIELKDKTLIVQDKMIKQFDLEKLRLAFLFFPGHFSWYVIASSQQINSLNIDLLNEDESKLLQESISDIRKQNIYLKSYKYYLADYKGQSTIINLKELAAHEISLLSVLMQCKTQRVNNRKEWIKTYPKLELDGSFGAKLILTVDGLRIRNKFLEWEKVATYEIEEQYFGKSHFRIIPEGVSTGLFSFQKHKYTLGNISTKKYPQYMAECEFWRSLKGVEGNTDFVSKLKNLKKLKDEGVLSDERFEEAKKKLLMLETNQL